MSSAPPPIPRPARRAICRQWTDFVIIAVGSVAILAWIIHLIVGALRRPDSPPQPVSAPVPVVAPKTVNPWRLDPNTNLVSQVRVLNPRAEWDRTPSGVPELWMSADWQNTGAHPIQQLYGRFEVRGRRGELLMSQYDWAYYGDGSEEPYAAVPGGGVYIVRNLRAEGEPFSVALFDRKPTDYDVTVYFFPTQAYPTLEADVDPGR